MVNAQEWLEQNYPNKEKTKRIYINQQLKRVLDCSEYKNLWGIYISTQVNSNKFEIKKGSYVRGKAKHGASETEIVFCIPAQTWLEQNYPSLEKREEVNLDISEKGLEGDLDLTSFTNLKELSCHTNFLTTLNLDNLEQLEGLDCSDNYLTQMPHLPNPEKITGLWIGNNNLSSQDLSNFSQFRNLECLRIHNKNKNKINQGIYNHFYGSLKPLRNMNKLSVLNISNTDIDSGLEYLPESIENFFCSFDNKSEARVSDIWEELQPFEGEDFVDKLKSWRKVKLDKQLPLTISPLLPPQLINKIKKGNKFRENYGIPNTNYNEIHFNQWIDRNKLSTKSLPTKLYNIGNEEKKEEGKVELTEGKDIQNYAILSYVWGNPGQESEEIMEKYGLENVKDKKLNISGNKALYKAIRAIEAINQKKHKEVIKEQNPNITKKELEKKLENYKNPETDVNYLWMDQLCINQDDNEEKNQEVPKMRQYYSNADYTLISINTELGDISDVDLIDILKAIVRSEWFTRSWTFQEGWLSKHTIFMFDDKLIDGWAMAGTWALNQLKYTGEAGYNSRREFDKGTKKIATPVGWTYFRDGYNLEDEVKMTLNQALKEIKNRGRGIPVDGVYSILGLLPYGEKMPVKYKGNLCKECKKQETEQNRSIVCDEKHSEKTWWPKYFKEDLDKVLIEVMKVATEDNYAELIAWHGEGNDWLPKIYEDGSTSVEGGIKVRGLGLNFETENIALYTNNYQIQRVDKGIYKRESGFEVEGGLYEKKVLVRLEGLFPEHQTEIKKLNKDLENNLITLRGTKKTMELVEKGVLLAALPEFESIKPFALLLKYTDESNQDISFHRLGLVELGVGSEKLKIDKNYLVENLVKIKIPYRTQSNLNFSSSTTLQPQHQPQIYSSVLSQNLQSDYPTPYQSNTPNTYPPQSYPQPIYPSQPNPSSGFPTQQQTNIPQQFYNQQYQNQQGYNLHTTSNLGDIYINQGRYYVKLNNNYHEVRLNRQTNQWEYVQQQYQVQQIQYPPYWKG